MVSIGDLVGLIWANMKAFLALNLRNEVFWSVLPLVLATILIMAYFTRHKDERVGWNTYFSNSLVLLFVSINLFRYIYTLEGVGASNYLDFPEKSIAVLLLLVMGSVYMRLNFSHLLPERYARLMNSPLGINLVAYGVVLHVYSPMPLSWIGVLSLVVLVVILGLIVEILKFPLIELSTLMKREQEKERFSNIKEAKFEIDELERALRERREELEGIKLKKIEKERKTLTKLKKAIVK